ncbi:MAG TPA: glycine zipper domain-containing protein [Chthoniobacter sp.]|jgi:hypothetical protein
MKKIVPLLSLSLCTLFGFTACDTPGHSALAGAATGAAIGGLATGRGGGALVGAALGAGTGYLIGKQVQSDRRAAYDQGYNDGRYADDGSSGPAGPGPGFPLGRFTDRPGIVTSPYPPYNNIDVRDIPRGAKVQDPSTGKIFINP